MGRTTLRTFESTRDARKHSSLHMVMMGGRGLCESKRAMPWRGREGQCQNQRNRDVSHIPTATAGGDAREPVEPARGPPAVALPRHLNSPERWFLLAGVLKVMIFMQTSSAYTWLFATYGYAVPSGPLAGLAMLAFGLGLLKLAHWILDTNLLQRRFTIPCIVLGSFIALALSRAYLSREMAYLRSLPPAAEERIVMERQAAKERKVAARPRLKALPTVEDGDKLWDEMEKRDDAKKHTPQ